MQFRLSWVPPTNLMLMVIMYTQCLTHLFMLITWRPNQNHISSHSDQEEANCSTQQSLSLFNVHWVSAYSTVMFWSRGGQLTCAAPPVLLFAAQKHCIFRYKTNISQGTEMWNLLSFWQNETQLREQKSSSYFFHWLWVQSENILYIDNRS